MIPWRAAQGSIKNSFPKQLLQRLGIFELPARALQGVATEQSWGQLQLVKSWGPWESLPWLKRKGASCPFSPTPPGKAAGFLGHQGFGQCHRGKKTLELSWCGRGGASGDNLEFIEVVWGFEEIT